MEETAIRERRGTGNPPDDSRETLDITLRRGWVYGNIAFREEMKHLIEASSSEKSTNKGVEEKIEAYMGHPVKSASLINKALKEKEMDSPIMKCYTEIIRNGGNNDDISQLL